MTTTPIRLFRAETSFGIPQVPSDASGVTDFTHGSNIDFAPGPLRGDCGNGMRALLVKGTGESAVLSKAWTSPHDLTITLATDSGATASHVIGMAGTVTIHSGFPGAAGNLRKVEVIDASTDSIGLHAVYSADTKTLTITRGSTAGAKAALTVGTGNGAVTFTTPVAGSFPTYNVAIVTGATGGELSAAYSGTTHTLTVTLGMNAGTRSALTVTDSNGLGSIVFTCPVAGVAGNDVTVAFQTKTGNSLAASATYDAPTKAIVVSLGTDASGDPDADKNTDTALAALVNTAYGSTIAVSGGAGYFDNNKAAAHLTGGVDSVPDPLKNTATLVAAAAAVSSWTATAGGTGATAVTAHASAPCTGGGVGYVAVVPSATDVADWINNNTATVANFTATATNGGNIGTSAAAFLTGGGTGITITSTLADVLVLLAGETSITATLHAGANSSQLCEAQTVTMSGGVNGIPMKRGEALLSDDWLYVAIGNNTVRDSSNLRKVQLHALNYTPPS